MRRYGGRESDYSVCPRPLLQFLQFFLFMSDRLRQVMPGYIRLSQLTLEGRDVELDNCHSEVSEASKWGFLGVDNTTRPFPGV